MIEIDMTPSQKAKALGCDSLAQVITVSGVPRSTLADWYESRPFVFAAVCEKVAWHKAIADAIADAIIENRKESQQ